MTTEERLDKLEREFTAAKRGTRWLVAVLVLFIGAWVAVWAVTREKQGRYALAGDNGAVFILDTNKGQLWWRAPLGGTGRIIDCGTIDNPKKEQKEPKEGL